MASSPAENIVLYVMGKQCKLNKGLRSAVDDVIQKHERTLLHTVKTLLATGRSLEATFLSTAKEIFTDNTCSWARILIVYIFGAYLAKTYKEECVQFDITRFAGTMDIFLMIKCGKWMDEHGSFEQMEACFPAPKEDRVMKGLLFTAVIALTAICVVSITR